MQDVEKIGKFKKWLTKRGAVVQPETNEWELVRFRASGGVSIIYHNRYGDWTFTGESEKAWKAYISNKSWHSVDRKRQQLRAKKARLAARDGKNCFACLAKLGFDELTIEHILSFSHGGTDNDNNLCLLCEPCNKEFGNLPIVKKIAILIRKREEHSHVPTA